MTIYFLIFLIVYIGAIPGIIIGGLQEKKGVPSKAILTFTAPDGTKRQGQVDVTWSWTVFIFRGWALAFRGQFLPFLIVMLLTLFTFGTGIISIILLAGAPVGGAGEYAIPSISEWFATASTSVIVWKTIMIAGYLVVINYYVAFANKERILQQINRGFDFSSTPGVDELYKYIGHTPRVAPKAGTSIKAGTSHDYVVPDAVVEQEKEENDYDYSNLTVNDLKLLLKSEGIPYTTSDTKESLLDLVDEHIVAPAKEEEAKKKAAIKKSAAEKTEAEKLLAEAKAYKEEAERIRREAEQIKEEATKETQISKKKEK